jgi:hypothetical protein
LHFVRRPVIKDAEIDHRFSETWSFYVLK